MSQAAKLADFTSDIGVWTGNRWADTTGVYSYSFRYLPLRLSTVGPLQTAVLFALWLLNSHFWKQFHRTFFSGASLLKFHVFWIWLIWALGKCGCFTFLKRSISKREDSPKLNLLSFEVMLGSRGAKLHAFSAFYWGHRTEFHKWRFSAHSAARRPPQRIISSSVYRYKHSCEIISAESRVWTVRGTLVNDQLGAQLFYFILSILQSSTCFEQRREHHQEVKLY